VGLSQCWFLSAPDRSGDSEGESLACPPQQGSGGGSWPPGQPEDSDNHRNIKRTGSPSSAGDAPFTQSQYQLAQERGVVKLNRRLLQSETLASRSLAWCDPQDTGYRV